MGDIFNQLMQEGSHFIQKLTGISIPPVILIVVLIVAIIKGMKTIAKFACWVLAIYVIYRMMQAGIIPNLLSMITQFHMADILEKMKLLLS